MKISVALCTYNGEKYIEEQIQSILSQSIKPQEIVICDDSSKDRTVEIIKNILSSSGIEYRIEVNTESLGVAANFLKALKMTTGDFVFTSDQDDIWHPEKVEVFMKEAEKHPADLYFSNGLLVDGKGESLGALLWEAYGISFEEINSKPLFLKLLQTPLVTGAAMMVTKNLIQQVSAIPKGFLHDEWLSFVAALSDSARPVNQVTFSYRQHGNNVIGAKKLGFFTRLSRWLEGFGELKEKREIYRQRCAEIASLAKTSDYEKEAHEAEEFWSALCSFKNMSCMKRIKCAFSLRKKGYYHRFYTADRGFVRDVIAALFC